MLQAGRRVTRLIGGGISRTEHTSETSSTARRRPHPHLLVQRPALGMPLASQPAQATSASAAAAFQPPAAHAHHHSQQQQRAHRLHHPRPISSSAATAALRFGLPLACRATAPAAAGHHNSRQGSEAEGSAAMYVCVSSAADDTDASASEDMRSPQSSSEAIDTDGCASSSSCNSPIPPRVLTDHPYGALSGGETLFPSSTSSGVVPPAMHGLGPRKPSTGRGRSAVVASTESELEESDSSASYTSFRCNPSTHHSRARPSLRVRSVSSSSSSASAAADARTTSRSTRPRVLVTGGAGFIGSHVARALLERGEDLVIVDELNDYYDPALKIDNLRQLVDDYGHSRVHTYVADICDAPAMQKCYELEHYDRIIHLAARAGVRPSLQDPLLYERSNVQGTLTLLELVKNSKGAIKHFVYASSSSVYGDDACVPFSENDPCNTPVSVYAATKKSCELLATTYAQLYQIPCSGLRFFTVFGPGGRRDMAPFIFIDRIARGLPITQFGDGTTERDYTYIDDIVSGVIKTLDNVPGQLVNAQKDTASDSSLHQAYNLGVGSPISLSNFIQTIATELGIPAKIQVHPKQPGDVERTYADVTKAKRLLGYHPAFSVQEGVRKTVAWYVRTVMPQQAKEPTQVQGSPEVPSQTPQEIAAATIASHLAAITANNSSSSTSSTSTSATFPPLPHCLVATRIHNGGSSRIGLSPDVFSHLLIWLPRALACGQHVAIAVDTTNGRTDISDAVNRVLQGLKGEDRKRVEVVGVAPWQSFVPALNALLGHAQTKLCSTILYSSLEIQMHPAHVHTLRAHLLADTLVVGARLSGHRFVRGEAVIDGCSTPWNTAALWSVQKLMRTGFLAISDGLPQREIHDESGKVIKTLPAVGGGVEEVVCISAQQKMFPTSSAAKLLSMASKEDAMWHHGTGESVAHANPTAAVTTSHASSSSSTSSASPPTVPSSSPAASDQASTTDGGASESTEEEEREPKAAGRRGADQQLLYDDAATPNNAITTPAGEKPRRLVSYGSSGASASGSAGSSSSSSATSATTIPSLFWDAHFGGDAEREAWHEKKMRSKIERPAAQLEEMGLEPGKVVHIHCVLSA